MLTLSQLDVVEGQALQSQQTLLQDSIWLVNIWVQSYSIFILICVQNNKLFNFPIMLTPLWEDYGNGWVIWSLTVATFCFFCFFLPIS